MIKRWPEFIRHGKSDVLPFAVRQDILLLCYPLFGGFHPAGIAAFAFAALAEIFGVRAVKGGAAITADTHSASAASEHPLDDQFSPFGNGRAVFNKPVAQ